MAPHKEIPWCTIFLCCGALFCHSMVFIGNMDTSNVVFDMGKSVHGWSKVGLAVSKTLHSELDGLLSNVTAALTEAINRTVQTQKIIDAILSTMGSTSNEAALVAVQRINMLQLSGETVQNPVGQIMKTVMKVLGALPTFKEGLEAFKGMMEHLKPVLMQVGIWVETFADKVQATVEAFGTTLDRVQKLFDHIMTQFSPDAGQNADVMEHETFNLFDVDGSGAIDADDLKTIGDLYAVDALMGSKVDELMEIHDADGDGEISVDEFPTLVADQSIIGIMATALRAYAKRLSIVAGRVGAGVMRDEVASSVVTFFQLVCSKNLTKAEWVSQMLTNGTLPMPFTADVMAELALQKDNPDMLTTSDVGEIVIGMMMTLDKDYTLKSLDLMASAEHWISEGFNADDQPMVVRQVAAWTQSGPEAVEKLKNNMVDLRANASHSPSMSSPLEDDLLRKVMEAMPMAAERLSQGRVRRHKWQVHRDRAARRAELFGTRAQQSLLDELLHGVAATDGGPIDRATQAMSRGVPAKPETRLFAQWLSANATGWANAFQQECFEYTGESSSALDAFNTQILGMVKKLSGFIEIMKRYATPAGIEKLETIVTNFTSQAMKDVFEIVVTKVIDMLGGEGAGRSLLRYDDFVSDSHMESNATLEASLMAELHVMRRASGERSLSAASAVQAPPGVPTGVWEQASAMLREMESVLPTAIEVLKFARQEVSEVSATMDSIFSTLEEKGKPIFDKIGLAYKIVWTFYFFCVGPLTLCILLYGFWASGWFGGPKVDQQEDYEAPQGCVDRIKCCCRCCCDCLVRCHDYTSCFLSFMLLFQIIVLVLFLMAILFIVVAGIEIFMGTSCAQIYLLGDRTICSDTLTMLATFLSTFQISDAEVPLTMACTHYNLLTCDLIRNKLLSSATMTVTGSILAAVFCFELIFEVAIMYERHHWRKVINEMALQTEKNRKPTTK